MNIDDIINVVYAEVRKLNFFNLVSYFNIISLVLWPILSILTVWFIYRSFDVDSLSLDYINTESDLMMFLLIGFLGQTCYWNITQSAWQMGLERINGTLETIFISPVSIFYVIIGRALSSFIQSVVVSVVIFSVLVIIYRGFSNFLAMELIISALVLTIPALIWGVFMNVIFLFTREAGFVYDICSTPMELFSGVKVPVEVFPMWAMSISSIFPLTYSLYIVRSIMFNIQIDYLRVFIFVLINISLFIISKIMITSAIRHSRKTGNFSKY